MEHFLKYILIRFEAVLLSYSCLVEVQRVTYAVNTPSPQVLQSTVCNNSSLTAQRTHSLPVTLPKHVLFHLAGPFIRWACTVLALPLGVSVGENHSFLQSRDKVG